MTRRPGRPTVGPAIKIRLPVELLAAVDAAARDAGVSRAAWVREACASMVARSSERDVMHALFGVMGAEAGLRWLQSPCWDLGGVTPWDAIVDGDEGRVAGVISAMASD